MAAPGTGGDRRYRLLGPLQVADGDRPVEIGTAKQRALLTILLLRANHVVPTDALIDKLWSGQPPASATTTLHGYVSGLRRTLGADAIRTASPGYVLDLAPDALDVDVFQRLHAEGRAALAGEDWSAASTALRHALDLWRGPALADVAAEPFAVADAVRLDQARLAAIDGWARAELALGRHAEVAGDLEAALAESPLREDLRARLVLALYRCGRQAEALRSLAAGRALLVNEVGIDPGPELVALEAAILAQDPALAWSPIRTASAPGTGLPSASHAPSTALFGRDDELAALLGELSAALAGDGRIALLGGEPGIGKTRLAEEVARVGAERGATIAWGRCPQARGVPAFWPWSQIAGDLSERFGMDAAIDALGASAADIAVFAPALADRLGPDAPPPVADAEAARFRACEATIRLLSVLSQRRPIVVVLDDAHWSDTASLELLSHLAGAAPRMAVLVVVTYRSSDPVLGGPLIETLATMARHRMPRIDLTGLRPAAVADFLDGARLAATPAVVDDVHRRTHGNPFFLGELVRWMESSTDADQMSVPTAVGDVIRDRVSRLPAPVGAALGDASILGQHLEAELLGAVIGLEPLPLLDLLAPALAAGLLVGDGLRGRWRFSHGLVCETLVAGLDISRRTQLHLRAAEAISRQHGESPGPHLAAMAHHLVQAVPAAPRSHAIAALRDAAAWAEAHLSPEQAIEHLQTALSLTAELPPSAARDMSELQLYEPLSRLLLLTFGNGSPALDVARARTRELCSTLAHDHPMVVPALWRLCTFHTVRTEFDIALDLANQMLDIGVVSADPARVLMGRTAAGMVQTHRSRFAEAREHLDAALALGRAGHDAPYAELLPETPMVWTLLFSAWNRWTLGDDVAAEREVSEALGLADAAGAESYAAAFARWFGTWIATLRQDAPTALERCDRALATARAGGYRMLVALILANRGWAQAAAGDIENGIAAIDEGAAGAALSGVRMLQPVFAGYVADAHLRCGALADAEVNARRGIAAAAETGERWYEPELHRLLGVSLGGQGNVAAARDALRSAVDLATEQGGTQLLDRATRSLAELTT